MSAGNFVSSKKNWEEGRGLLTSLNQVSQQNTGIMALRLQSSVHGKIRRLLMVDEEGLTPEERNSFLQVLQQVFKNKPAHTQLIVWCESQVESQSLGAWFRREIPRIVVTNDVNDSNPKNLLLLSPFKERRVSFSRWVRDSYLAFEGTANSFTTLALSHNDQSSITSELDLIGWRNEVRVTELLVFAGGDILVVGGLILVGQATILNTENKLYLDCYDLAADYKRGNVLSLIAERFEVGVDKIVPIVLPEFEPLSFFYKENWCCLQNSKAKKNISPIDPELIHIDIFITPTGEIKNSKPLIFLATLLDVNTNDTGRIDTLSGKLDMIATSLMSRFEIERNSIPCVRLKGGSWTFLFYNNCIVENSSDSKSVWLPDHLSHLDALDVDDDDIKELTTIQNENKAKWTDLCFKIVPIKADFVPFLTEKGSIHCLTKELEREI